MKNIKEKEKKVNKREYHVEFNVTVTSDSRPEKTFPELIRTCFKGYEYNSRISNLKRNLS